MPDKTDTGRWGRWGRGVGKERTEEREEGRGKWCGLKSDGRKWA